MAFAVKHFAPLLCKNIVPCWLYTVHPVLITSIINYKIRNTLGQANEYQVSLLFYLSANSAIISVFFTAYGGLPILLEYFFVERVWFCLAVFGPELGGHFQAVFDRQLRIGHHFPCIMGSIWPSSKSTTLRQLSPQNPYQKTFCNFLAIGVLMR